MKTINTKRPSKLDLDAPLLSARRSNLIALSNNNNDISRSNSLIESTYRVPFQWEQSPGKPKNNHPTTENLVEGTALLPLPKPPPMHWQAEANRSEEEEEEEEEEEVDVIDLFSLVGSLDTTTERGEAADENESESESDSSTEDVKIMSSPSFMIKRFLPAAAALASSSSLSGLGTDKKKHAKGIYRKDDCIPRRAPLSSRGYCGLQVLFPWRVKHRVCGVKSPVREPRPRLKSPRHFSMH